MLTEQHSSPSLSFSLLCRRIGKGIRLKSKSKKFSALSREENIRIRTALKNQSTDSSLLGNKKDIRRI